MSHWEPKIVSFLCNWCSYGAADLAGVSRMEYPPNIRVIRIPCTEQTASGSPGDIPANAITWKVIIMPAESLLYSTT